MNKKKILIVDDEQDIRTVLKRRFEFCGFECLTAQDGREAIKLARHTTPSLIILDLVMPDMDGADVYMALKADDETKNIPVILYSAQSPGVVAEKGEAMLDLAAKEVDVLGVVDFILKPCGGETLMAAVDEALGCTEKV